VGTAGDYANSYADTNSNAYPDTDTYAGLPGVERQRSLYRRHVRYL
jgi:hypothetical protein